MLSWGAISVCMCPQISVPHTNTHRFLCFPWRQVYASNANSATTHPWPPLPHFLTASLTKPLKLGKKTNNLKIVDGLWTGLRPFGQYCKLRQMLGGKKKVLDMDSDGLISYTVELKQAHTHKHKYTMWLNLSCPPLHPHTHFQSKQKCHSWNNSHFQC